MADRATWLRGLVRRLPQGAVDFLYAHRFHPLLRPGRQLLLRAAGGPDAGLPIERGPLTGWKLAFGDSLAIWMGRHEPEVQAALQRLLRPGLVAYDIGAHIGYMVLLMAKEVGPEGQVVAYEPDPGNAELLRRNIALNDVGDRVQVRTVALGAEAGHGSVERFDQSGLSKIAVGVDGEGATEITTLDLELAAGLPVPDLILIDTEGMEGDIFRGAAGLLADSDPVLVVEHHEQEADLTQQLSALGYHCHPLDDEHVIYTKSTEPA